MNKRKRIAITIITIILAVILVNIAYAKTGIVTTDTIRLREKPSTDSKTIDMADYNDKIEIIGEEGDWYKVSYNGKEGYMAKEYLKVVDESTTSTPASQDQPMEEPENVGTQTTTTPEATTTPETVPTPEVTEEPEPEVEVPTTERTLGNVTNNNTNGYLLPNITSIKISEIEKGTTVTIIKTISNWSKVENNGQKVWVANEFLMTETQAPEETPEEVPEETPETEPEQTDGNATETKEGYVSANGSVNLRSEANQNSKSLGKLKKYTVVTIIAEENDWYKVSYNGQEGYISKQYVVIGAVPEDASSRSTDEPRQDNVQPVEETANSSIVETAQLYLNSKYVSGGKSPSTGFDCSGFTYYVYKLHGKSIPASSKTQYSSGNKIDKSAIQPGDLVFFSDNGSTSGINHVGIYIGNGKFIHAANPKRGVVINSLNGGDNYGYDKKFVGAARY